MWGPCAAGAEREPQAHTCSPNHAPPLCRPQQNASQFTDGLHLTPAGYQVFYDCLKPQVINVLKMSQIARALAAKNLPKGPTTVQPVGRPPLGAKKAALPQHQLQEVAQPAQAAQQPLVAKQQPQPLVLKQQPQPLVLKQQPQPLVLKQPAKT